jgi:hypothetical protein
MYTVSHLLYKVEAHGLENFSYTPSTVIASAHKRDIDISVVVPCLYFMKQPGRLRDLRGLYFPARDDVFERGFLMIYFPWLDRLRFLMRRSSVAWNFWAVQACPVKLPDEQTANQLLNETIRLEGDLPLPQFLTPEWCKKLMGDLPANSNLHLSDVVKLAPLTALAQYATPRMFKEPLASGIRERHHHTIISQLRSLTRILDKGGSLFIAPEGRVSPDGRFGKMRAAFTRVVQQTHVNVTMLPINLTYDFMDTERPKVIVNVGPEINNLTEYSKAELSELVKQKVGILTAVTLSGIASKWLIAASEDGREWVRLSQFRNETWEEVLRLRQAGLLVDRRLATRQGFEERLARFVEYGYTKGQLFLKTGLEDSPSSADLMAASDFSPTYDRWLHLNLANLLRSECNKPDDNPARYSCNELLSLLEVSKMLPSSRQPLPLLFEAAATRRTAG